MKPSQAINLSPPPTPGRALRCAAVFCLLVLAAAAPMGCGGGGGGSASGTRATGNVLFTIEFPAREVGRAIPPQTQLIRLFFKNGANPVTISDTPLPTVTAGGGEASLTDSDRAVLISRPPGQGAVSVTVRLTLPIGDFTATAQALTNLNAAPIAVATDIPMNPVTEGGTTTVTLTLASTVRSLSILANGTAVVSPLTLNAQETRVLGATATNGLNGTGNPVVFDPDRLTWSVSDQNKARIDTSPAGVTTLTALKSTYTSGDSDPVVVTATFNDGVASAVAQTFLLNVKPTVTLSWTARPGSTETANSLIKQGGEVDVKATVVGANNPAVAFRIVTAPKATSLTGQTAPNAQNETTILFTAPEGASADGTYTIEARVTEAGNSATGTTSIEVSEVTISLSAAPPSVAKLSGAPTASNRSTVTATIVGAVDTTLAWSVDGPSSRGSMAPASTTTNPATATYTAGSDTDAQTVKAKWGPDNSVEGTVNIQVQ